MMVEIAHQMLAEFQEERAKQAGIAIDAQAAIDSGRHNAFLELAFRRNRDDATARVVALDLKIQVIWDLIERMDRCQT